MNLRSLEPLRRFNHMTHNLTKTFVLIFAVGAPLMCGMAFAATATAVTLAPHGNAQSTAPAKSSRPIFMFLPDAANRTPQMPFSWYQGKQTANVANIKKAGNGASPAAPALLPGQETRATTSLIIGWLPAKEDKNTTSLYQPGPYQYVSTAPEAGCQATDRTAGNSGEAPDGVRKGLHLPAGWLLGMCLHY